MGEGRPDDHEPRLAVLRRGSKRWPTVFVSLESLPGTADPAPRELVGYARELGAAADRMAAAEPLPGRSAVIRDLRAVPQPPGMAPLADTRLVSLAAAAEQGGFLALTVRTSHLPRTAAALAAAYPQLVQVDLGALFVAEFRALAAELSTDWAKVLCADERFATGSPMPGGLRSYATRVWDRVAARLREQSADGADSRRTLAGRTRWAFNPGCY